MATESGTNQTTTQPTQPAATPTKPAPSPLPLSGVRVVSNRQTGESHVEGLQNLPAGTRVSYDTATGQVYAEAPSKAAAVYSGGVQVAATRPPITYNPETKTSTITPSVGTPYVVRGDQTLGQAAGPQTYRMEVGGKSIVNLVAAANPPLPIVQMSIAPKQTQAEQPAPKPYISGGGPAGPTTPYNIAESKYQYISPFVANPKYVAPATKITYEGKETTVGDVKQQLAASGYKDISASSEGGKVKFSYTKPGEAAAAQPSASSQFWSSGLLGIMTGEASKPGTGFNLGLSKLGKEFEKPPPSASELAGREAGYTQQLKATAAVRKDFGDVGQYFPTELGIRDTVTGASEAFGGMVASIAVPVATTAVGGVQAALATDRASSDYFKGTAQAGLAESVFQGGVVYGFTKAGEVTGKIASMKLLGGSPVGGAVIRAVPAAGIGLYSAESEWTRTGNLPRTVGAFLGTAGPILLGEALSNQRTTPLPRGPERGGVEKGKSPDAGGETLKETRPPPEGPIDIFVDFTREGMLPRVDVQFWNPPRGADFGATPTPKPSGGGGTAAAITPPPAEPTIVGRGEPFIFRPPKKTSAAPPSTADIIPPGARPSGAGGEVVVIEPARPVELEKPAEAAKTTAAELEKFKFNELTRERAGGEFLDLVQKRKPLARIDEESRSMLDVRTVPQEIELARVGGKLPDVSFFELPKVRDTGDFAVKLKDEPGGITTPREKPIEEFKPPEEKPPEKGGFGGVPFLMFPGGGGGGGSDGRGLLAVRKVAARSRDVLSAEEATFKRPSKVKLSGYFGPATARTNLFKGTGKGKKK